VEENTMKKMLALTTSLIASASLVPITMAQGVVTFSYTDKTSREAYYEHLRKQARIMEEHFEKGRTDDAALKEAILLLEFIIGHYSKADSFVSVVEGMHQREIPLERQIQGLENIIRETLSAAEENEDRHDSLSLGVFLAVLDVYPDYDIQPILDECFNSKSEIIQERARRRQKIIMERTQAQPTPSDDGEATSTSPTPSDPPQPEPEPTPPVLTNEAVHPILESPSEQPEKSSSNKPLFWGAIVALLALLGGVIAWRRTP
jgi:hypothetical protein